MNRREFVTGGLALALGVAVETMLPTDVAADTQPRMYLPLVIAKPEPPQYDARKGAVIIRSSDDVAMLGAGWWYDYTPDPSYAAPGFVPMIRDPYQLADFRDSGWSTDIIAEGATVLFYNEPNLVDQMYGLDLTPADVAAACGSTMPMIAASSACAGSRRGGIPIGRTPAASVGPRNG